MNVEGLLNFEVRSLQMTDVTVRHNIWAVAATQMCSSAGGFLKC
jgi:hypothetical protein